MASVDIAFPITAKTMIPRDHGYALYAALSRCLPALHGADWLAVHPLPGTAVGDQLELGDGRHLRLRVPDARIADLLPLTGKSLTIQGAQLSLGVPRVYQLASAATLDARLVYIKITTPPTRHHDELGRDALDNDLLAERYAQEITRQLAAQAISCPFELRGRRSLTVSGQRLVGFSVRVGELPPTESLRLQERGLGGKRAMGCGVFRATRRKSA